tara:strand:+ start:1412 stop:2239 length:828 start_codon:yes stop_codon:yes gene_type:complete
MNKKSFIVPHDFTSVGDIALEHAIAVAEPLDAQIFLLHVVAREKDINDAEKNLEKVCDKFKESKIQLIPNVRRGSIFEDIGDFAAEHHAELIFMGTHGAKGWQHLTGSHALKVVTSSSVPFIIVQDKSIKQDGYSDIVVPMDLNKETKQKLGMVANLAQYFNSRVHVLVPEESDEFLKHHAQANIQFAKKFFKQREVQMEHLFISKSDFDKEVVNYSVSVNADLMAIMNLNRSGVMGVIGSNYEQHLITNDAKIPVLIVNPIDQGPARGYSTAFG